MFPSAPRKRAPASCISAALVWMATAAFAQQQTTPPNFSDGFEVGWTAAGGGAGGFAPVAGRVPPLATDPAHPFAANNNTEGRQPTPRIPTSPIPT